MYCIQIKEKRISTVLMGLVSFPVVMALEFLFGVKMILEYLICFGLKFGS